MMTPLGLRERQRALAVTPWIQIYSLLTSWYRSFVVGLS